MFWSVNVLWFFLHLKLVEKGINNPDFLSSDPSSAPETWGKLITSVMGVSSGSFESFKSC